MSRDDRSEEELSPKTVWWLGVAVGAAGLIIICSIIAAIKDHIEWIIDRKVEKAIGPIESKVQTLEWKAEIESCMRSTNITFRNPR